MSQQVLVVVKDDLDNSEGATTVRFGLDGQSYEIDLSDKNAAAMREAFDKYVKAARKVTATRSSGPRSRTHTTARSGRNGEAAEVREWAKRNGVEVNERGRIPAEVKAKFQEANG